MFKINRDKELSQLRKAMAEMTRERDRLKKSIEIKENAISERERELLCEIAKAKELQEKYKEAILRFLSDRTPRTQTPEYSKR